MSESHTIVSSASIKPHLKESDFYKPYLSSDFTKKYHALELLSEKSKKAEFVAKKLFEKPIEIGDKLYDFLKITKSTSQLPKHVALGKKRIEFNFYIRVAARITHNLLIYHKFFQTDP